MCSVVRSKICKRDCKHPIYPNDQRWLVARSITLRKKILVEKMKYHSYNIKARVVMEQFHLLLFSIKDSTFPIHMIGKSCYNQGKR